MYAWRAEYFDNAKDKVPSNIEIIEAEDEADRTQPDTANTFKPVRSTPAPCNGANGAMVSWLSPVIRGRFDEWAAGFGPWRIE
jgi:hypothetical protein